MVKRKSGYGFTRLERMHGGKRKRWHGALRYPKDRWASKAQVKRSIAFKRLKKTGYEPRVKKW